MTLQEAKEIVCKKNHDIEYRTFYLISGFPEIIKLNDEAAELYARSKWDEALELAEENIFATIDESRERIIKLQNEFK